MDRGIENGKRDRQWTEGYGEWPETENDQTCGAVKPSLPANSFGGRTVPLCASRFRLAWHVLLLSARMVTKCEKMENAKAVKCRTDLLAKMPHGTNWTYQALWADVSDHPGDQSERRTQISKELRRTFPGSDFNLLCRLRGGWIFGFEAF
ncbi:hypothetical protein Bbelb_024490 [Branchiostoma belcheri]|nr:hypothetical protein Bbelb_441560 [Branchiostoma belcheri]KAI8485915.1 hypothetical protein Bbelb_364670 [Branchiostoma belcheri]KAI8487996.1 hypothetical protein Bbelb_344440 [Branchiostoma belcheri]KAI8488886.1 hypothetical protein Bbelb_334040 [Branchiostoma belcheri]KAI8519192.1 hypothetical protein Bbelb_024490 [Branchiostoma belcheri]